MSAAGGDALLGGVLPTPAAPLLIGRYGFDLAAVLSASHNPYQDNGIKFFAGDGYKLSDETEHQIERELERAHESRTAGKDAPPAIGRVRELRGAPEDYLRELHTRFAELDLAGLDVLLDCANGATYQVAPEIFRRLGANVTVIGRRAGRAQHQRGCGSTHVEALAQRVLAGGHALGFAFDGDGDRVLAVDRLGGVVDGDELMALAALHLRDSRTPDRQRRGGDGDDQLRLPLGDGARRRRGCERRRSATATCSRSCARAAGRSAASSPGHIIEMGFNRTGDGIAGALLTLEALAGQGPERARRDGQAAPAPGERARARPRRAGRGRGRSRGGERRGARRCRAAGACSCARAAPSRSCG